MKPEITAISLKMPRKMGLVNCYLLKTSRGMVLIDSGPRNARAELLRALAEAGCEPGQLNLLVLTHGDFDHTGNAAFFQREYGVKIGMHPADAPMLERGDMFVGRKRPIFPVTQLAPLLFGFGRAQHTRPDVLLEEGAELDAYGLRARVLSIPGHSSGSIGVLTSAGNCYCGDLVENLGQPKLNSLMDNREKAWESVERLRELVTGRLYPGHGAPFALDHLAPREEAEA